MPARKKSSKPGNLHLYNHSAASCYDSGHSQCRPESTSRNLNDLDLSYWNASPKVSAPGPPFELSLSSMNGFSVNEPVNLGHTFKLKPGDTVYNAEISEFGQGVTRDVQTNVLNDQFGLLGLALARQSQNGSAALSPLSAGFSVTSVGLTLPPFGSAVETFSGPLGPDGQLGPDQLSPPVRVEEYDIAAGIKHVDFYEQYPSLTGKSVQPLDVIKHNDDTLFYMFYTFVGDASQMIAANELYRRNWRYDKLHLNWIRRSMNPAHRSHFKFGSAHESGYYTVFKYSAWRKVTRNLTVEYKNIEVPHKI